MAQASDDTARLDVVARLTRDITGADEATLSRLRALCAAAVAASPADHPDEFFSRMAQLIVTEDERDTVRAARLERADQRTPPLCVVRHDERQNLLEARIAGPLSALAAAERLGPFDLDGGRVWFDFYRAARRFEVSETGATAPAFVMTSARRPAGTPIGPLTLDLQPGTIWIRGNLLSEDLPAGAYAGITVSDGKLTLLHTVNVGTDTVEVAAPLEAKLSLTLATDSVSPSAAGCKADASVTLPTLTLSFGPAGLTIGGGAGKATAWGKDFAFKEPTGTVAFIAKLWTLVLGYSFAPDRFDADDIKVALADFRETTRIVKAGLGLPVVVAKPAILGPATVPPGWWLALKRLQARFYADETRYHGLDAWMGIGHQGVTLFSENSAPLERPVTSTFRLWELGESPGKRLPWRHHYDVPFLFYHRCDAALGEDLLTTGSAKVVLDRPVQTNGAPVRTPTTVGVMHQHKGAGDVRVTLAALVGPSGENQLALRNALIWATRAFVMVAHGTLIHESLIDAGTTHVFFGVFAWAPTLPDPYVGNFQLCRPAVENPRALLVARIGWTTPGAAKTEFFGNLGPPIVCEKPASPIQPVPARKGKREADVGVTQTEQGALHLDEKRSAEWNNARAREARARGTRVAQAEQENNRSREAIDGFIDKVLGRTPPLLLLDVSTNQDLLGVALWGAVTRRTQVGLGSTSGPEAIGLAATTVPSGQLKFPVQALDVHSPVEALRLVTLPQIQWEPVRTLDIDQDILTLGWFPTPLASATDGGATVLGTHWQKLAPVIPEDVLEGTRDAFAGGAEVVFKTTLPFGLVTVVQVDPKDKPGRPADRYELTRPEFPDTNARGGIQITAKAEAGRDSEGGVSPYFAGMTRQLINGVDLATGAALGLSVLSSTGDPMGDVETIFNTDMTQNPKVPVTRFDLSGYGGSNFSKWENPFALFAETSKAQFQVMLGRTALEIIKVASVLHPWGIRVTRSVIVERRSGGGVIRRDTGWQATSPGLLDYRYMDTSTSPPVPKVADYAFDAGVFKGLFDVRAIRPAPGVVFAHGSASFVPYYFDADLALEGLPGRIPAIGVLGWLQTAPSGDPADKSALKALIEAQGPVGGPIDAWIAFGASTMPFRARRIEIGLADDAGSPLLVATVRGVPKFPKTGAWSVVCRDVAGVPSGAGEAVPVSETRGVPIIRRYPVEYAAGDTATYSEPPLKSGATKGDWRFADAEDLLTPAAPQKDYCLLQSTPTHAFLFPRPYAKQTGAARVLSDLKPELADIIARSTSKGAFPPPENVIALGSTYHFNVGAGGTLALSSPISVVNYPTPLRISGSQGHGTEMLYDAATLQLQINATGWSAEFTGLEIWTDIAGMRHTSGARLRIVGSTYQRPQIARIDTLVQETIEEIMTYLPIFGAREPLGPVDLGASNAKHEIKLEVSFDKDVPQNGWSIGGGNVLKLSLGTSQQTGFDLTTGGVKASAILKAGLKGEFPITGIIYIIVELDVKFSIASVSGSVTAEKFDLIAFVGIGVKGSIGPFQAYASLGIGFVLSYDITTDTPKYGGLVRLEAGVEVVVVKVKLTAELQGLVYKQIVDSKDKTMCDYSGSVKLQVDIFLIISISATYSFSGTKALE